MFPSRSIRLTDSPRLSAIKAFLERKISHIRFADIVYPKAATVSRYFHKFTPAIKKWEDVKKYNVELLNKLVKRKIIIVSNRSATTLVFLRASSLLPIMVKMGDVSMIAWKRYVIKKSISELEIKKELKPAKFEKYNAKIVELKAEYTQQTSVWSLLHLFATISEILFRCLNFVKEVSNRNPLFVILGLEMASATFVFATLIREFVSAVISNESKKVLIAKGLDCLSQLLRILRPLLLIISAALGWSAIANVSIGMLSCIVGLFRCIKETIALQTSKNVTSEDRAILAAQWISWGLALILAIGGIIEIALRITTPQIFIVLQAALAIISITMFAVTVSKAARS